MSATADDLLNSLDPEPSDEQPSAGNTGGDANANDGKTEGSNAGTGENGKGTDASAKDKIDPAKPDAAVEKVVPLRALQEEREAAKELKRQIAELQAQPKLSPEDAELLKELKAQRAAQKAEPVKEPDFLEDPKGYVDAKVQKALDELKTVSKKTDEVDSTVTQQKQVGALLNAISAHEQAFTAQNPDYLAALEHVRSIRKAQILLMAPEATEQQVSAFINNEELATAHQLIAKGKNPCEFAYNYAKTMGYKKAEAPAPKGEPKPEVDKSAVRTMGAGGADVDTDLDEDNPNGEFLEAVKERFKGKR